MPIFTHPISTLAPGAAFARYAIAIAKAHGNRALAAEFTKDLTDTPWLQHALKSAIGPQHSDGLTSPLIIGGIAAEALPLLRDRSVFDQVSGRMQRRPFVIPIGRETGAGTAGLWLAEGLAMPIVKFAFDTLRLPPHKAGAIAVIANEMLLFGDPVLEKTIRDILLNALAVFTDAQFLDPDVEATSGSPASITSSGTEVTSTGTTAAQLTADLAAHVAGITTSGRGLVWIMRPTTGARIALGLGAAAADFPRTLFGIPVVLNANSPQQVTLADLAEIAYADAEDLDVELSESAAVQMEDTPSNATLSAGSPTDDTTPTSLVSFFQTNSVGLKVSRHVTWEVVRTGAVSFMETTY